MKSLNFADGFESASEPTQGNLTSNALKVFASDAAYVTDKGSAAAQGDIYSNSTTDKIRFYNDAGWVDVVLEDASGNVTLDGNLVVTGDLTINGTTTTINTATLEVEDKNILINNGGDDSTSEGAGITVERTSTSGSLVYEDALASKFKLGAAGSEAQVVTVSHTQTLTNKTLTSPSLTTPSLDVMTLDGQASTPASPSAGFYKAYVKDSTNKLTLLDSSGNETSIGAGGGSVNFVTNPDAEAGTTGWTIDSFAAAARPAGALTGTTAGITFSTSSSSPLSGVNSFTLTKDASNRQGRVVYTPITIQPAYQARVLDVSIDYIVSSGTFVAGSSGVDSDVIVYLQDVTNSTFIEPSSFKFLSNSSSIADRFQGTFQTSATGTSYRLLLYFPTTSASAFTLKLDNISVSPSTYVFGTPITDWQSFTPTVSHTTNATSTGMKRRVGDVEEYLVRTAYAGATDNAGYTITIANGKSIDTSKLLGTQGGLSPFGIAAGHDSGGTHSGIVVYASTTTVQIIGDDGSGGWNGAGGNPFTPGSGDYVETKFSVPILGWSSSVQTSDQTDTRVLQAKLGGSTTSITASATLVQFDSAQYDSHGLLTTGASSRFTASMPGFYNVNAFIQFNGAAIGYGGIQTLSLYKNGSSFDVLDRQNWSSVTVQVALSGSTKIYLVADDYIDLRATNNTTTSIDGNAYMTIERATGPSAIAASESITVKAYDTAGTTINSSNNTKPFATEVYDSHGAFDGSTGIFTAPISGKYHFDVNHMSSSTLAASDQWFMLAYKNASTIVAADVKAGTGAANTYNAVRVSGSIDLLAGETLQFNSHTGAATLTLTSTSGYNQLSIHRVGN